MKKFILIVLAVAGFSTLSNAQLSSGTFFAGGSLGFNSSSNTSKIGSVSNDDYKATSFYFNPSVGYFVADRTAVGLSVGFASNKTTYNYTNADKNTYTSSPISVSIFARRFLMLNETFGFFGGVNVGPTFGKSKNESYNHITGNTTTQENKISGFGANLNAGTIWFPASHIGIEASVGVLGYSSTKTTVKNSNPESSTTNKGLTFGVNSMALNFGFHYYFFN